MASIMRCVVLAVVVALGLGCGQATRPGAASPEQEQFIAIVKRNADDPSGLEIVEWGELKDNQRHVRFRCKQIGVTMAGRLVQGGEKQVGGVPVPMENAMVVYDGKNIKTVHLPRSSGTWYAK